MKSKRQKRMEAIDRLYEALKKRMKMEPSEDNTASIKRLTEAIVNTESKL